MARDGEFKAAIEGVVARTDAEVRAASAVPAPAGDLFGEVEPPAGSDQPSSLAVTKGGAPGKRGPGKRSSTLAKYLAAKGYRDPGAGLAELASQDPLELWNWFRKMDPVAAPSLVDVVRLQASVRTALLPYVHAKVPPRVDKGERLAVMILSGGSETDEEAVDGALTIEAEWSEVD